MSTQVRIGFIPLVDCAPLVALHELGFAREEGLEIVLSRETSWSNVRDKLAVRLYDASHLLAPMALATNLGLGGPRADIVAPYILNLNGDVICASTQLLDRMAEDGLDGASAMLEAIRRNLLGRPMVIGVPFFFSTHHYLVRYWLASAGIDPDRQVRVEIIPPSLMAEAVRSGVIDGFCVGEPWGSVAVDAGLATIALPGRAVWAAAPEKVLGLRRSSTARPVPRLGLGRRPRQPHDPQRAAGRRTLRRRPRRGDRTRPLRQSHPDAARRAGPGRPLHGVPHRVRHLPVAIAGPVVLRADGALGSPAPRACTARRCAWSPPTCRAPTPSSRARSTRRPRRPPCAASCSSAPIGSATARCSTRTRWHSGTAARRSVGSGAGRSRALSGMTMVRGRGNAKQ